MATTVTVKRQWSITGGTGSDDAHYQLFRAVNALTTAMVALLAKMDADFADVTNASTDYASSIDGGNLITVATYESGD